MTDDLQRAVDAARRIVADEECYPHAVGSEGWRTGLIARALLSIISTRDDVIEEAAKACEEVGVDWDKVGEWQKFHAAAYIARHLRSLKSSTSL